MKKILSMGIASAVLALTAIAASAAEFTAASNENPVNGGTITVEVTAAEDLETYDFTVAAEGLELASVDLPVGICDYVPSADGTSINVAGAAMDKFVAGTPLATITYTVTAETGADVKVTLSQYKDTTATFAAPIELTVVEAAGGDTSDPAENPGENPGGENPGENPGGENPGGDNTTPPDTGVALAVVPAVLAGAAVVVAKKRK